MMYRVGGERSLDIYSFLGGNLEYYSDNGLPS